MQSLVLYYEAPDRRPGLVCVGRFDGDLQVLRNLPDGTRISFQTAAG